MLTNCCGNQSITTSSRIWEPSYRRTTPRRRETKYHSFYQRFVSAKKLHLQLELRLLCKSQAAMDMSQVVMNVSEGHDRHVTSEKGYIAGSPWTHHKLAAFPSGDIWVLSDAGIQSSFDGFILRCSLWIADHQLIQVKLSLRLSVGALTPNAMPSGSVSKWPVSLPLVWLLLDTNLQKIPFYWIDWAQTARLRANSTGRLLKPVPDAVKILTRKPVAHCLHRNYAWFYGEMEQHIPTVLA